MATATITYKGDLRTEATHTKSGNVIVTDAPTDNHGKGEAFSPTDIVCAALASCMMTIMGIAARTHHINLEGMSAEVTKIMQDSPRKIAEVIVDFKFQHTYTDKEKQILEHAAKTCPVALSLADDVKKTVNFNWV